ncbi:hypothetical protein JOD51_003016 [Curtobacterium herbarum]|nr:hypothetical protein [Curtobacterium herbarum]
MTEYSDETKRLAHGLAAKVGRSWRERTVS